MGKKYKNELVKSTIKNEDLGKDINTELSGRVSITGI